MLVRYFELHGAADAVVEAWRHHPDGLAISLIGSLARRPWKEVPRFWPYRQERIKIWHESADADLALWLSKTDELAALCEFNQCPKPRKTACLVSGCGEVKFLRRFMRLRWRSSSLERGRCVPLFDHSTGLRRKAAQLPLPGFDFPVTGLSVH